MRHEYLSRSCSRWIVTARAALAAGTELLERLNGDGRALTLAQFWVRDTESAQFEVKAAKTQSTERGTAPGAILDKLAGVVKEEAFWGALEAAGITPDV